MTCQILPLPTDRRVPAARIFHGRRLRAAAGFALLLNVLMVTTAAATTWFVRSDGGSPSQCTGTTDAAYSGSGQDQPCALAHPFYLLPPSGNTLMVGGDTMQINAGQYRMGLGAPGAQNCNANAPWNCTLAPVPAGTATNPTRITGKLSGGVCRNPPKLWGVERARNVLSIQNTSHVELSCLEVTDHSSCIDGGATRACRRDGAPYGNWAQAGLRMEDASNIKISDLNIHGLANTGIRGGRLRDVSFTRVKINGNAWSGLDWDLGSDNSSNAGTILFDRVEIAYNGCAEGYPDISDNFCWAQIEGGYGDGFGSSFTGGDFIIRDSYIHHNTSDGFDFLYADNTASLTVVRSRFVANAGNQLKSSGATTIDSSEFIGECAHFEGRDYMRADDNCRARGNALSLNFYRGATISVSNSTVTGEGDCLIVSGCRDSSCNGTETMNLRNNVFLGQVDWYQPSQKACLVYAIDQPGFQPRYENNVVSNVKNNVCPGGTNICADPQVRNRTISNFNGELNASSPAVDAANAAYSTNLDVLRRERPRGQGPDIGAYESGSATSPPVIGFVTSSLRVSEGDNPRTIAVRLNRAAPTDTSIWVATAPGSATQGQDFYGFGQKISIAAGQTAAQIAFQIIDDQVTESSESFSVRLFKPEGLTLGVSRLTINISDNDSGEQPPTVSVAPDSFAEAAGTAQVRLSLSKPSSVATRVAVSTRPATARNGSDFYGIYQLVDFAPGQTSAAVNLTILNDTEREGEETFTVNLFAATGLIISAPSAQMVILDDD